MQTQTLFGLELVQIKTKPHGSCGVKDAIKLFHTTELRRVVSRLKKKGLNITDKWEEFGGDRYKVYKLKK